MRKAVYVLFTWLALAGNVYAQTEFLAGTATVHLGIGFGNYWGSGYKTLVPPISASFEYGVVDGLLNGKASVGVGAYLAATSTQWEEQVTDFHEYYNYSYSTLGARGTFHYHLLDNVDTYAGVLIGYNFINSSGVGSRPKAIPNEPTAAIFIGARYYFVPELAVYAEIKDGYASISSMEFGIALNISALLK
ncbi:MAG: hypothetical protein LBD45_09140 [Bacteroidales bacterium]|jgi:hypothetical protein|nr:hypothetical protein [Bacteroidales bacterium]